MFIVLPSIQAALHVYPSDRDRHLPMGVGIRGLRHKLRHKISSARLSSPIVQGYPGPTAVYMYLVACRKKFLRSSQNEGSSAQTIRCCELQDSGLVR
jgi:hypothetical protein